MESMNCFHTTSYLELFHVLGAVLIIFMIILSAYHLTYFLTNHTLLMFMNLSDKKSLAYKKIVKPDFIEEENLLLTKIFKDKS